MRYNAPNAVKTFYTRSPSSSPSPDPSTTPDPPKRGPSSGIPKPIKPESRRTGMKPIRPKKFSSPPAKMVEVPPQWPVELPIDDLVDRTPSPEDTQSLLSEYSCTLESLPELNEEEGSDNNDSLYSVPENTSRRTPVENTNIRRTSNEGVMFPEMRNKCSPSSPEVLDNMCNGNTERSYVLPSERIRNSMKESKCSPLSSRKSSVEKFGLKNSKSSDFLSVTRSPGYPLKNSKSSDRIGLKNSRSSDRLAGLKHSRSSDRLAGLKHSKSSDKLRCSNENLCPKSQQLSDHLKYGIFGGGKIKRSKSNVSVKSNDGDSEVRELVFRLRVNDVESLIRLRLGFR
eukprot:sb/3466408/